jgi:hypothetical protein
VTKLLLSLEKLDPRNQAGLDPLRLFRRQPFRRLRAGLGLDAVPQTLADALRQRDESSADILPALSVINAIAGLPRSRWTPMMLGALFSTSGNTQLYCAQQCR